MFSSDRPGPAPQRIQEYKWPGLDQAPEAPTVTPFEFQPWDFVLSGADSPSNQALEAKVEEILEEARQKAQELERQAYEEGFRQGQQDGQEVGRRGLEEVVRRLEHLAQALEREREALFHQREKLLVELAVLVGEKLAARELSLHPETVREIIEGGFKQISHLEGVRVLVSPSDYEILKKEDLGSWPPGVELVADGTLTPGGCRVVTALGEVDGTREMRMALVRQAVQEALEALEGSFGNP